MRSGQLDPQAALTLLYGDADVLKERAVAQIVQACLHESEREFGLVRVHADEAGLEGIVTELASGSLMAPRRVLVVGNVDSLLNREQRQLAPRLERLQPGLTVVLVCACQPERRGWGPPVAADLRKVVQARGQVVGVSVPRSEQMPRWVAAEMQTLGKRITHSAAQTLCETAGTDLDRLLREIEKLAAYVGVREEVTDADVREVSAHVSAADVFKLMDAIGARDAAAALTMLDGVLPEHAKRDECIRFVGMVTRQLRLIWQARYLRQCHVSLAELRDLPPEVARRLPEHHSFLEAVKGKDWLAEGLTRQAARFSDGQLARALDRVYQADLALKGAGGKLDHRTVVELLIADLCR
ncbi:MAG: DNA polymerase III subunit delta [Armatimonadota bacterium]